MTAKVPKCHCLTIEGSSGKVVDPQLVIDSHPIPFILNKSINFLGMKVKVPSDAAAAKQELKAKLKHLLQTVDGCLVTCHQKLKLFKLAICPRLNWLLTINEYLITWIERELDLMMTKFLNKWAGLAKSANTSLLYLPHCDGGLNLPSPSSLY